MDTTDNTIDLKVNFVCRCDGCLKKLEKVLEEIGVKYDINLEEEKLTISGHPEIVIEKLKEKRRITATLLQNESQPMNNQDQDEKIPEQKQIQETSKKFLAKIGGKYDINLEEKKLTISNTVPPEIVIEKPKKRGKTATLLQKESQPVTITKNTQFSDRHKHKHQLELRNYQKRFSCDGCKEDGIGPRYRCKFSDCDYELHKECKIQEPIISHDFFEGYTFQFFEQLPKECGSYSCKEHASYCNACAKEICGFVYHCQEKGLNFHPCCSSLPTKRCIDGVSFELRKKASSNCFMCNQKVGGRSKKKGVSGWSYFCTSESEGYLQFHVYCVTQMVHEAWSKGAIPNPDSNALEKIRLPLVVNSKRKHGKGSQVFKTWTIFLRTIIGILLGDPTAIFASLVVELIQK